MTNDDEPVDAATETHPPQESIGEADRQVLRRLAGRIAELAARPVEQEKRRLWMGQNALRPARPLVFCDPENSWGEIITPDQLECTGGLARQWEQRLRKEVFWGASMRDDRVIEPWFNVGYVCTRGSWGLRETYEGGGEGGAHRWDSPIKDLDDLSGLEFPSVTVDRPATERLLELATAVLGDLLPVRLRGAWYWTLGLTWDFIRLRGLENLMLDMYDNPTGLHGLMGFLRDGTMDLVNTLEQRSLYSLNNEGDYVGSGGFGWTEELPAPGFDGRVRTRDLWCLSESQETVGVSPGMFEEFIFPYQLSLAERFGLVCYGCCEPVHTRFEVIRRIPNLRRVSVSPWCDREKMADYLGAGYVYSLKPHPGLLAGGHFDAEAVRADVNDALDRAQGCVLEFIMKDNHTIRNDPSRVVNWVRIVREEIDRRS
jgi:hypothetical protein